MYPYLWLQRLLGRGFSQIDGGVRQGSREQVSLPLVSGSHTIPVYPLPA